MAEEPYIPQEQPGPGPSAKVYRARDLSGDRTVRLKVLLTELESPFALDREHLAARVPVLQSIRHPTVCRLIDLDVQDRDMTLVNEYGEGLNGWAFVAQKPLTNGDLRSLAAQLMQALQAGEKVPSFHGDIKPANMIIERKGWEAVLHLQDWGVSQSRHLQPRETLSFRAPELLGENTLPTARGDLFSAGATLAALWIGGPLVEGHSPEALRTAWAAFAPAKLRLYRPDLELELQQWLEWLLKVDPRRRPASATEALAALEGPMVMPRSWGLIFLQLAYNLGVMTVLGGYLWWLLQRGKGG